MAQSRDLPAFGTLRATKGPMWGHPVPVLGAISPFLEPYRGRLSPNIDNVSETLTLRYPHEGPLVDPGFGNGIRDRNFFLSFGQTVRLHHFSPLCLLHPPGVRHPRLCPGRIRQTRRVPQLLVTPVRFVAWTYPHCDIHSHEWFVALPPFVRCTHHQCDARALISSLLILRARAVGLAGCRLAPAAGSAARRVRQLPEMSSWENMWSRDGGLKPGGVPPPQV